MLPLTFANDKDYSLVSAGDAVSTSGLDALLRGDLNAEIEIVVKSRQDGSEKRIKTVHGLSRDQVEWIREGSALNLIKKKAAQEAQQ